MSEEREVDDKEKALVTFYKNRIDAVLRANDKRFKLIKRNRRYYAGTNSLSTEGYSTVRTNLIFSTIAALLPQIYAKNPDISISPDEAVDDSQYDLYKAFAKTLEVVLTKMLVTEGKLKRRMKAAVRAAMLCQVGWLKLTYQKDVQTDPVIRNRLDDVKDNLSRVNALRIKLDDPDAMRDLDLTQAQLDSELAALQSNVEKVVSQGFVLDKLLTEDVLVLDDTVRDFDDYENAFALSHRIWMTEQDYEARFGYKPGKKAEKFHGVPAEDGGEPQRSGSGVTKEEEQCYYCVHEIWNYHQKTIFTWCQGEEGWCRQPYQPTGLGKRWYSFFALCFNPIDGQFYGVADVELLIGLSDEYNETRSKFAEHRKYSIPINVIRAGGGMSEDDINNIKKAQPGDTVVVQGDPGVPISNELQSIAGPPIDPAMYDVTPIRADIELVSGAMDAARGNVLKAKTATEAEIMNQGLTSRTDERRDTNEDMIQSMAQYAAEIVLQELDTETVVRLAGPKAVWPDENQRHVLDLINIDIRAGSTGKPNKMRDREQWIQIMPIIQAAMEKVMALRQGGMSDMADAMVELLRETLSRFDERIDIDSFLPRNQDGEGEGGADSAQAQQALMQAKQVIEQLQGEVQLLTQKADATVSKERTAAEDRAFKEEQAREDRTLSVAERKDKLANEMAIATETARIKAEAEERMEANRQREETNRELIRARASKGMTPSINEDGTPGESQEMLAIQQGFGQMGEAVTMLGQQFTEVIQQLSNALEGLAKATAAPRVAVRGPNGRIEKSVPDLTGMR